MEYNLFDYSNTYSINKYIVTDKCVGNGSSANVYIGFDKVTKQKVAVKKFIKNQEKANREIEILKNINHPNIIKLYDYYIDTKNNIIYLFLEFCDKKSIKNYLGKGGYLDENNTKKIMYQLISSLNFLFEKNIYHRDVKLDNILLTDDYNLKLADFGLSTINKTNYFKRLCGSPLYMAPEILVLNKYTIKSDIWSVGIVMFELLFGYNPNYKIKNLDDLLYFYKKNIITIPPKEKPDDFFLSDEGMDVLTQMLKINHMERIEWNDLFNHKWFYNIEIPHKNDLLENQNNINIENDDNNKTKNKYYVDNKIIIQKNNINFQNDKQMDILYDKNNSLVNSLSCETNKKSLIESIEISIH